MANATLQSLAKEARSFFGKAKRADGSEFWTHENAPEWVVTMCQDAHGEMFPDDHRYRFIVETLDSIEECQDPDDVQTDCDAMTHELTAWLASRADRYGYVDDAAKEFDMDKDASILTRLTWGQYAERSEVLGSVRSSLATRLAEMEDAEDE